MRLTPVLLLAALAACSPPQLPPPQSEALRVSEWPAYGGDLGGQRHATAAAITRENVESLAHAWTYHHGDVSDGRGEVASPTSFQNTPILAGGALYFCTPFNRVIALDPATGRELWVHDAEVDLTARYANDLVCRGVAHSAASGDTSQICARTLFTATNDARLLAIDAATGTRCPQFGTDGAVDLNPGPGPQQWKGEYQVTSPPAIVGDLVVVGSAVGDNARIDAPSGVVRAFDARSGQLRWAWDLAPPGFDYANGLVSAAGYALGTPNVWAAMAVDAERDLVFVPTGNASPDYYHGERSAMNHYGSSVVALRGATGEVVWHFQTVHDDLWDFDIPAQPTLTEIDLGSGPQPALVQTTKMGLLFVLNRETGEPLLEVTERAVTTQGAASGEVVSPTQPFPATPTLASDDISADTAWGLTPWDRGKCRDEIESLRFDGMYTPPSVQGTIMYPGNAGGSNWGGISVDPVRQIALVRTSNLAWVVSLVPRENMQREIELHRGHEIGAQIGTPYGMRRRMLSSPLGLPCVPPPWGTLAAVDLRSGAILWQVPHGTVRDIAPLPIPLKLGVPGLGGPITLQSGVAFIAAAMDDYLRAFDSDTGHELWKARLPGGGQATPMTYSVAFEDGTKRQYVVIAAGGHARMGTTAGDSLVAFALETPAAPL